MSMTAKESNIVAGFIKRAYPKFSEEMAKKETEFLDSCVTKVDYFRLRRAGSTVTMNRMERAAMWELYQNALNHAGFTAADYS